MSDAIVNLNGQRRKVGICKENTKTVLVYVPKGLRIRKRIRSMGRTYLEMLKDVSPDKKQVNIPNNHIVKRHKIKHNFKRV